MFMDAGGFHQRHAKRQNLSRGVVPDDNNDATEIGAPMVIDSHEAFAWLKTWAWVACPQVQSKSQQCLPIKTNSNCFNVSASAKTTYLSPCAN